MSESTIIYSYLLDGELIDRLAKESGLRDRLEKELYDALGRVEIGYRVDFNLEDEELLLTVDMEQIEEVLLRLMIFLVDGEEWAWPVRGLASKSEPDGLSFGKHNTRC